MPRGLVIDTPGGSNFAGFPLRNVGSLHVGGSGLPTAGYVGQFTGALLVTGEISAGGGLTITGGTGAPGRIYKHATFGLTIWGVAGSDSDWLLTNAAGAAVVKNPTGTTTLQAQGAVNVLGAMAVTGAATFSHKVTSTGGATRWFVAQGADPRFDLDGSRGWAMQSVDADGRFRIYDQTGATERLTISTVGLITVPGTLAVTGTSTLTGDVTIGGDLTVQGEDIIRGSATGALAVSGGSASNNGANYLMHGGSHASLASVHRWRADATELMRLNASGNLGIGTSDIEAWGSAFSAIEFGGGAIFSTKVANDSFHLLANAYFDGTNYKYKANSNAAQRISMSGGDISFNVAPDSGAAGADTNISWTTALTIANSGAATFSNNVTISKSAADGKFQVDRTDAGTVGILSAGGSTVIIGANSNHPLIFHANSAEKMRLNASGHLGLGTTDIEAWRSDYRALQIGDRGALVGPKTSGFATVLVDNAYDDGSWKYRSTAGATRFNMLDGKYTFQVAASGTIDTAITWTTALTIENSGEATFGDKLIAGGGTLSPNGLTEARIKGASLKTDISETTTHNVGVHVATRQTVATTGSLQGFEAYTYTDHPAGTVAKILGIIGNVEMKSTGTVTNLYGITSGIVFGANGTITNAAAIRIHDVANIGAAAGTVTNNYGIYIEERTFGTTLNYAIYVEGSTASRFGPISINGNITGMPLGSGIKGPTYIELNSVGFVPSINAGLYNNGGEIFAQDSGGVATQISPHDEEGNWIFHSFNLRTGYGIRIQVEKLLRAVEEHLGTAFIEEFQA